MTYTTDPASESGIMKHAFSGRRLSCIDMCNDSNVPGVLDRLVRLVR